MVVSSGWGVDNIANTLEIIIKQVQDNLTDNELLEISKVVFLKPDNKLVITINNFINIEHGSAYFNNLDIDEVEVRQAYIITSKAPKEECVLS